MPSINIQEVDLTLPGNPDSYANYGVLIPGFAKPGFDMSKCDNNGAIEFTSQGDFESTIGQVNPNVAGYYHYGNQMAHELLGMGYPVTYLPLLQTSVGDTQSQELDTTESAGEASADKSTVITQLGQLKEEDFWKQFKDKVSYDFRFIAHGLLTSSTKEETQVDTEQSGGTSNEEGTGAAQANLRTVETPGARVEATWEGTMDTTFINDVNKCIATLAGEREDCIALVELDERLYVQKVDSQGEPQASAEDAIKAAAKELELNVKDAKYCAITVPSVIYVGSSDEENRKFPGGFHYLACFSNAIQKGYAEWYAAAGYTRGVSKYSIDQTTVRLGEIAINALEPRQADDEFKTACNVIANFRGAYYLWGNRTAAQLDDTDLTAKHFLNIRQLCTTIKKQLFVACRRFTFDPNSDTLWVNFVNAIRPTLELMKADQGIRDYKILKEPTDKKATLKARIRIIPIEAVEDFDITVSLEDSFGDTVANIEG